MHGSRNAATRTATNERKDERTNETKTEKIRDAGKNELSSLASKKREKKLRRLIVEILDRDKYIYIYIYTQWNEEGGEERDAT